ncbi:DUF397 domain-containing protein [Streptomyces sp. NPDC014636]|uniref:DUF397 domain-containing protein n=1 Tax=Streptomyces sp. NPDC014636 TaxID=3364876 RepID=UPI0036FA23E3
MTPSGRRPRHRAGPGPGRLPAGCVEVAESLCATIAVRGSRTPAGPVLTLGPAVFTAFGNWAATAAG